MKINKILPITISAFLMFAPCYVYAVDETTPTPSNTPVETDKPEVTATPKPSATPTSTPEATSTPKPTSTPTSKPEASEDPDPTATPEVDYKISLNKEELSLNSGDTYTLKATVTPSDSDVKVVWSTSDKDIVEVDKEGKITTKGAGSATITATIDGTKVKTECEVKVTRTIGKDATLKDLNISNGSLDKTFKSSTFEYTVTVDSNVNSLKFTDLEKDLSDSHAGYLVTGNSKLKDGSVVSILVTAEDGETKNTYKLTIVKDEVNLNLKSLKISGYALNETFSKDTLDYTANIPNEIELITVQAVAEDKDAKVKVSGSTNLKVGENTVKVTVSDDSGNSKLYTIVVTRDKESKLEEKPTSIITSSIITDDTDDSDNEVTGSDKTEVKNDNDDNFLKYAIVSLGCLILFVIGGIGIYFYLKTSPKKLKKELEKINNEKPKNIESPVVEVESENKASNISNLMDEKLVETREFKKEEMPEVEKLFDEE